VAAVLLGRIACAGVCVASLASPALCNDLSGYPGDAFHEDPGPLAIGTDEELRLVDSYISVAAPVQNDGVIELLDSIAVFSGGLAINGALLFDPSTITISTLTVSPGGVLAETGDPGDRFIITEDFVNQSIRNEDWKTENTVFQFNGGYHDSTDPQTVEVAGADVGRLSGGWTYNFVLGTLHVGPSSTYVRLVDDYDNSSPCLGAGLCEQSATEALYVGDLLLESGTTLDLNGLALYVLNSVTDLGATILNGTVVIGAVPLPGDVDGDTRLTAADVALARRHVLGETVLGSAQTARGDVYPAPVGDGTVTLSDLLLIQRFLLQ